MEQQTPQQQQQQLQEENDDLAEHALQPGSPAWLAYVPFSWVRLYAALLGPVRLLAVASHALAWGGRDDEGPGGLAAGDA